MITKIIACSDIHMPSYSGIDELKNILSNFISDCKNIIDENGPENTRIIVCGDIFDAKIKITNESLMAVDWFFKELDNLCKTYIIAGNHDLLMTNIDRVDSLTPLFNIGNYNQVIYLDKELSYQSGCYLDDNVVFCLYSTFDNFSTPAISYEKEINNDKTFIGLIHADINGASTATNYICENGISPAVFSDLDFVIAGHIHKQQEIKQNGVKCVYCSSINQKDFGESIIGHGFVLWSLKNNNKWDYEFAEVDNFNNGYYKFEINGISDIENDNEILINL